MKRWEENLKRKVHTAIVLNAKPTITVKHNHPLRSPKTDRLFT